MSKTIGIFDSGLGGLTVVDQVLRAVPEASVIYVGDTLRCPYGTQDPKTVQTYALQIASWLIAQNIDYLVVACNTATVTALETLKNMSPVPVLGMIQAGAQGALQATQNKRIGVLATQITVNAHAYRQALHRLDGAVECFEYSASEFVRIVEANIARSSFGSNETEIIFSSEGIHDEVAKCIEPLVQNGVDTVILGCTHFPLLRPLIQDVLGSSVTLVDPACTVAKTLSDLAQKSPVNHTGSNARFERYYTTSPDVQRFRYAAEFILKKPLEAQYLSVNELEEHYKSNRAFNIMYTSNKEFMHE